MNFWKQFTFWIFLALALYLFIHAFTPLMKIVAGKIPNSGLREAIAA